MPTPPYAKVLTSISGDTAVGGPREPVAGSSTVQFSGESTVGWTQQRWELYAYPVGFTAPAGWTLDGATQIIYSTAVTPPSFTLPAAATRWGKWMVRLLVNEGVSNSQAVATLKDETGCVSVYSPQGQIDIAALETSQFDAFRAWVGAYQRNLRILEPLLGGGGAVTEANVRAALALAAGSIAVNSQRITGLLDPSSAQDAATKAYVDATAQGLDVKASVRAVATGAISLSGPQTIDGVSIIAGDRVLVTAQASAPTNGIYVCAAGAWSRSTDANSSAKVTTGLYTWVAEGTANADSGWILTTNDAIVLGTTALTFTQFSGAGQITAGTALSKTGNTLNVVAATSGVPGSMSAADKAKLDKSTDDVPLTIATTGTISGMALPNAKILRFTAGTAIALAGITAPAAGLARIYVVTGTAQITFNHEDAVNEATAANRFKMGAGGDQILTAGYSTVIFYDHTDARWKLCAYPI